MNFGSMGGAADGKDGGAAAAGMGLARQSSIYALTLDEFQHTLGGLGKDFGSMNMDEFLRSIWVAEETQYMASAVGLQRQGSLTLPRTISLKTVDEVWRDVAGVANGGGSGSGGGGGGGGGVGGEWSNLPPSPRQSQYGEMTLEEFLVKAGVVREDAGQCSQDGGGQGFFGGFPAGNASDGDAGLGIGFLPPAGCNGGGDAVVNSLLGTPKGEVDFGIGGIGDAVAIRGGVGGTRPPAVGGSPTSNGDLSSLSPTSCVFGKGPGRKAGSVEKAVERRQKRMIKNRESAARSRARKQAYTMDLEAEVSKLKEQNQALMLKQAKILEMQKKQILESADKQEEYKRRKLRRTQTGPW